MTNKEKKLFIINWLSQNNLVIDRLDVEHDSQKTESETGRTLMNVPTAKIIIETHSL